MRKTERVWKEKHVLRLRVKDRERKETEKREIVKREKEGTWWCRDETDFQRGARTPNTMLSMNLAADS